MGFPSFLSFLFFFLFICQTALILSWGNMMVTQIILIKYELWLKPEDVDLVVFFFFFFFFKCGIFRCVVLNAKEAEDKHILSVHSKNHLKLIKNISSKQFDSRRNRIASKFNSIYMNEGSSEAACLAAGSVIEVISLRHTLSI